MTRIRIPPKADLGRSKLKIRVGEFAAGTIFLLCIAFAIVRLSLTVPPPEQKAPPPDRYSGSIVIPTNNDAVCRRLTFDNRTGEITDQGRGNCLTWQDGPERAEVLSEIAKSFRGK